MMDPSAETSIALIRALTTLMMGIVLLRVLLQATRADFYNPISQRIVRLTNPVLQPIRSIVPSRGRIDYAGLLVAVVIQGLMMALMISLLGFSIPSPLLLLAWSGISVLALTINLYFFCLVAMIVLSWVAPSSHHPAIRLAYQVAEPVMAPFRALLPSFGGLDFSPILVFIAINLATAGLHNLALRLQLPLALASGF